MSSVNHHLSGVQYWRSLEHLADDPKVREMMACEFPGYDPDSLRLMSRRKFMKLMAASMALAGLTLTGCRRWPEERLAPFTANPKGRVPGVPQQFATAMEFAGVSHGLLVNSFDGRPIKVEGNPNHPFARTVADRMGAADAYAQASVLELYDPDRAGGVRRIERGQASASSWDAFEQAISDQLARMRSSCGGDFAVLCEATDSPSVANMRARLFKTFPQMQWHEYEPVGRENEREGTRLAFGQVLRPRLLLGRAAVVVSFDEDLLGSHPAHIRYANDWSNRRRQVDQGRMNRMYVAESSFSITGAVADERLATRASRLDALVGALAAALGVRGATAVAGLTDEERRFVDNAAADLKRGHGVVAAGPNLSPQTHAKVWAINSAIGAIGDTVALLRVPDPDRPGHLAGLTNLAGRMQRGQVNLLLILGGNPAYDAPVDVDFKALLAKVPLTIHHSRYVDETSLACDWHLPKAHYLEAWGDGRAWDGTITVMQPMIYPLFDGRSMIEVLALFGADSVRDGEQIVRRTLAEMNFVQPSTLEMGFRKILHDGVVENSGYPAVNASAGNVSFAMQPEPSRGFELRFTPDACVYDGRFANSGWLQELPDPLTKVTWDNPALLSTADAARLGVGNGDIIRIAVNGRALQIAAYVLPGQPQGVIGLALGYGRQAAGNVGTGVGFDTYSIRTSEAFYSAEGAEVARTGGTYELAMTQDHHLMDEVGASAVRERVGEKNQSGKIIHEALLAEYVARPGTLEEPAPPRKVSLQLFEPPFETPAKRENGPTAFNYPNAWGMAIDMNTCIGCNACVVACQAENNVPVVGKDQVLYSREMHWLRIDRYFKGPVDDPEVVYQPMMCVHCENAPCEQVCPVGATMHDTEGLNTMVYNRCIGTRYCSNNCPYKVRRFNYFDFHAKDPRGSAKPYLGMPDEEQAQISQIKQMLFNPEVTVRMRGVMEKCTYCVQRIHTTKIAKRNLGEALNDGDVVTACQEACPTQAIVFGDLNDPNSKVTQLHGNRRAYALLDEHLNTRPRSVHLAKIRNPASVEAPTAQTEHE